MKDKLQQLLEAQAFFVVAAIWLIWFQFLSPYLYGFDGYFHMKFALLTRLQGILYEFPWTELSTWSEWYSDKDFLFHVFLIPFTYFADLAEGGKYAVVVLAALVLTSVFFILRRYEVGYPAVWVLCLPLMSIDFALRMNLTRPHILGVFLLLWVVYAVIERRYKTLALLSFFFPWAHSSYILPLVWIGTLAVVTWLSGRKGYGKAFLICFVATLSGTIIHPYFPSNWELFYLQNVVVMDKGLGAEQLIPLGRELGAHSTRTFLLQNAFSVILMFFAAVLLVARKVELTERRIAWCWIAVFAFGMTFLMRRFAEIWVPINLIAASQIVVPFLLGQAQPGERIRRVALTLIILGIALGSFVFSYRVIVAELAGKHPNIEVAANYFEEHSEPGELIFTCDWDDGGLLFFFNHHNHYLVMLDPTFATQYDPQKAQNWRRLVTGAYGTESASRLKEMFDTRYGYCTKEFSSFEQIVKQDSRFRLIGEDSASFWFEIL